MLTVNQILNIVLLDWLHINKVGKKNITMASSASVSNEFWHTNLADVPVITGSFIEKFARENLPIKASLS